MRNRLRNPLRVSLDRMRALRREVQALWYAGRDPRTPWYARALALAVVGYALSPIDLIPDFVPVLGALDDLLIIAGGVYLLRHMIPSAVLAEARERALEVRPRNGHSRERLGVARMQSAGGAIIANRPEFAV